MQRCGMFIFFLAIAAVLLLSGCGSDPFADKRVLEPEWYDPADSIQDDGTVYGYGSGESNSRRLAESIADAEARAGIAQTISGEVAGILEATASQMDAEEIETAREAMESFFDQELYGVQVDQRDLIQDEETQEYKAFYRVRLDGDLYDELLEAAMTDETLGTTIPAHEEAQEALDEARERRE